MISAKLLRLENLPDITFPGMRVVVPYPGSTPEEMELLIVRPVEEALATLSGIEEIRAERAVRPGEFRHPVQLGPRRRCRRVRCPHQARLDPAAAAGGADRMQMFAFSAGDEPMVVIRVAADTDLTDQYETLEKYLQAPDRAHRGRGTGRLQGVQPREVRILIDPNRLAAYSVDVQKLRAVLESSNFSVSAGEITENDSRFTVRPIGEFRSLEDVRNLIIAPGVRIEDIAQVELVAPELPIGRRMDGRPAVGIDVFKSTQANVVDVADRVMAAVEEGARSAAAAGHRDPGRRATRPTASATRCASCAMRA